MTDLTRKRITGFEGVSEDKDDFPTSALEWRLSQSSMYFMICKNIKSPQKYSQGRRLNPKASLDFLKLRCKRMKRMSMLEIYTCF